MAVDGNPDTLAAAWEALSEPVRAAVLATTLGLILAFRSNERSIVKKLIEVAAAAATGFMLGMILHMAGFEPWVIWTSNTVVAILGVDKVREIVDYAVDTYIYRKGERKNEQVL